MQKYTDLLGYEPNKDDIFIVVDDKGVYPYGSGKTITKRFDYEYDNIDDYPKERNASTTSNAAGIITDTGKGKIYLIKYTGKRWIKLNSRKKVL